MADEEKKERLVYDEFEAFEDNCGIKQEVIDAHAEWGALCELYKSAAGEDRERRKLAIKTYVQAFFHPLVGSLNVERVTAKINDEYKAGYMVDIGFTGGSKRHQDDYINLRVRQVLVSRDELEEFCRKLHMSLSMLGDALNPHKWEGTTVWTREDGEKMVFKYAARIAQDELDKALEDEDAEDGDSEEDEPFAHITKDNDYDDGSGEEQEE